MGEGCARSVADEETRSRKARRRHYGEVKIPAAIEKYETLFNTRSGLNGRL